MSQTLSEEKDVFKKDLLKTTIAHRQNLVNYFESFLNRSYKPAKIPRINLEDDNAVEYYFFTTGNRLNDIKGFFAIGGTAWQKRRLTMVFTRGLRNEMDF